MISSAEDIEQVDYDEDSQQAVEGSSLAPAVLMEEEDTISEVTTRSHAQVLEKEAIPSDMNVEESSTGKR